LTIEEAIKAIMSVESSLLKPYRSHCLPGSEKDAVENSEGLKYLNLKNEGGREDDWSDSYYRVIAVIAIILSLSIALARVQRH